MPQQYIQATILAGGLPLLLTPLDDVRDYLDKEKIQVNSFHHQAIDKLGNGLLCRGFSSDNIIETVEAPEKFWVIGVQWHPELMINHAVEQQNLFKTLVTKSLENMQ